MLSQLIILLLFADFKRSIAKKRYCASLLDTAVFIPLHAAIAIDVEFKINHDIKTKKYFMIIHLIKIKQLIQNVTSTWNDSELYTG